MRLKSVFISRYKNLVNFSLNFDSDSFLEVFVGKNGSGKSNLFEALVEIFRHLVEFDSSDNEISFEYRIRYEIDGQETSVEWDNERFTVNGRVRRTIGRTPLPDNILIYYSGHNSTVSNLVDRYEAAFRRRIRGANLEESRRFLGIGPGYRSLLLTVLLAQPEGNTAREFVRHKLGISEMGLAIPGSNETTEPVTRLTLQRPEYARNNRDFDIEANDETDRYWKAAGITKGFLDVLTRCVETTPGNLTVSQGYFASEDQYVLYISITKLQTELNVLNAQGLFRQFDNLRTLGMLSDISVPLKLIGGAEGDIGFFSDGQFQAVYIYAIAEIFTGSNCLTLLDEPDGFLHPEWQFDFLKQVIEITDRSTTNNHVLMNSHSAATLISHNQRKVRFFDIRDNVVNCYEVPKAVAIKKLSSDLIRYSEPDQLLSIINTIQIANKPVLFTEGSTDPLILKEAWSQLYGTEMPFIPFYAFSCTYIKQLLTDNRIHAEMGGLPIFALFDFDKAYDQWNGLNGDVLVTNPLDGLIKKWRDGESYAIMLPVPQHPDLQRQVIKNATSGETFGGESHCEIEHLFYGQASAAAYFHSEPCPGGERIVFKSDSSKVTFAKDIVPMLPRECFAPLTPVFDFIRTKCPPPPA